MHEDAILHEIAERPDDDAVRLIYADWLDDHGEPARAGFVRDQLALEKMDVADPRYPETLARSRRWGAFTGERRRPYVDHVPGARVTFRRGLISGVEITAGVWRSQPVEPWRLVPAEQVRLARGREQPPPLPPNAPRLAARPELSRLRSLVVDVWTDLDEARSLLTGCPALAGLRALAVEESAWDDREAFADLWRRLALPALESLRLHESVDEWQPALEACPNPLRRLWVAHETERWEEDVFAQALSWDRLRQSTHWASLEQATIFHRTWYSTHEDVELAGMGEECQSALATSGLRRLTLTPADAAALARRDDWGPLRELYVGRDEDREDVSALANSPAASRLEALGMEGGYLSPAGAEAFYLSPHLANLRRLGLWPLWSAEEADRFLKASFLPRLLWLEIGGVEGTEQRLAAAPLPELRRLGLYTDDVRRLEPLLAAGTMPNLCTLELPYLKSKDAEALAVLARAKGMPHLSLVWIGSRQWGRGYVLGGGEARPVAPGVIPIDEDWWDLGPWYPWP